MLPNTSDSFLHFKKKRFTVDKYFLHFEKVAENFKWPKEHWTLLLQSVVIGKAREIIQAEMTGNTTDMTGFIASWANFNDVATRETSLLHDLTLVNLLQKSSQVLVYMTLNRDSLCYSREKKQNW